MTQVAQKLLQGIDLQRGKLFLFFKDLVKGRRDSSRSYYWVPLFLTHWGFKKMRGKTAHTDFRVNF